MNWKRSWMIKFAVCFVAWCPRSSSCYWKLYYLEYAILVCDDPLLHLKYLSWVAPSTCILMYLYGTLPVNLVGTQTYLDSHMLKTFIDHHKHKFFQVTSCSKLSLSLGWNNDLTSPERWLMPGQKWILSSWDVAVFPLSQAVFGCQLPVHFSKTQQNIHLE